jgi:hypothetical protein
MGISVAASAPAPDASLHQQMGWLETQALAFGRTLGGETLAYRSSARMIAVALG